MPSPQDVINTRSRGAKATRPLTPAILEGVAMMVGLLYFGIIGLLLTSVSGVLKLVLPRKLGIKVGRILIHLIFSRFVAYLRFTRLLEIDLSELKRLGKLDHPLIVAPNHASLWDAVFMLASVPSAICVMKKSILKNPVLGGGARLAGHIPNDALTRMIRSASTALSQGGQLILFPEGTRTAPSARWINPLKGGCAIIAARSGVPVYPLFIRSNSRFLQKGWPFWRKPVFPIVMDFKLGEPMQPAEGESAQEFTLRLQQIFEQELSKPHPLRRQVEAGAE